MNKVATATANAANKVATAANKLEADSVTVRQFKEMELKQVRIRNNTAQP